MAVVVMKALFPGLFLHSFSAQIQIQVIKEIVEIPDSYLKTVMKKIVTKQEILTTSEYVEVICHFIWQGCWFLLLTLCIYQRYSEPYVDYASGFIEVVFIHIF